MRNAIVVSVLLMPTLAGAADGSSLCAAPEQAAKVKPLYAGATAPPPMMAARRLELSEAIVASAIDQDRAVGTPGSSFDVVWKSLQSWGTATTVVLKGEMVFEIIGPIPPGEPSTRSSYYNLKPPGNGLGGHLRPDQLGAIYALDIAGGEGPIRGVTFMDAGGNSVFGVFLPEAKEHGSEAQAKFRATRELIRSLPRVCPAA
jgi:hypothetical protein